MTGYIMSIVGSFDYAFGRPANQSSTLIGDIEYPAGNAVDSDPLTFSHTRVDTTDPWWTIEFTHAVYVTDVYIENRRRRKEDDTLCMLARI